MDDEDVEVINQREADRMSWCLADVVQLHGDPGFGASRSTPGTTARRSSIRAWTRRPKA